jgi:D-3-phosphoglycerate dehydrogenase
MDYMENGNITHSVNYPDCDMGICTAESRVAILHKNQAGLIASFTTILGNEKINVDDMTNKSRGDYAYTLLDLGSKLNDKVVDEIKNVDGVIKVRVVK